MDEESGDLPATLEITKPNEGNVRRSSMGKASSSNSREKVLSRYLRASTGSCHDFCKYGRKHEFEAKERRPLQKRITKSAPDNQSPKVSVMVPERKELSVVRPNPSIVSKSSMDIPKAEFIKGGVCINSPDGQNVNASPAGQISVKSEVQSGMKKTSAAKLRTSPKSITHLSKSPELKTHEESSSSEKVNVSSKKVSSKSEETMASAKNATSMKLKSSGMNMEDPEVDVKQAPTSCRLPLASSRASLSPEPSKVAVEKTPASPRLSLASPRVSPSSKPSTVRIAILNLRKPKSLKVVAETEESKYELKQTDKDLVHEETLYVINMETDYKSLKSVQNASCAVESSPSPSALSPSPKCIPTSPSLSLQDEEDQEQSEYTETEPEDDYLSESEYEAVMSMEGEESSIDECHGKHKKDGIVHSEDKDSQALKLQFRRGKIVDIRSESNIPKRLKFRRGRVLGQNQNRKPCLEKVVLRHQDVQGKKDSQVLFNHVIEQTATKLVETQKSKVKALVGAFETVISLQDSKPSANVCT